MKSSFRVRSIVSFALLSSVLQFPPIASARNSEPKPELTLLVFNYTRLSSGQITEIRARVAFIFEQAGIQINWLNCRPVPEHQSIPAACQQPPGPSHLAIRLLDHTFDQETGLAHTVLGLSFASETGGSLATLSCDAVERFARGNRTLEASYLGHAIAHEIGHLLLGTGAHCNEGIMKAQWNSSELKQIEAARQGLLFPKEQVRNLRMSLAVRQETAGSDQAASGARK